VSESVSQSVSGGENRRRKGLELFELLVTMLSFQLIDKSKWYTQIPNTKAMIWFYICKTTGKTI